MDTTRGSREDSRRILGSFHRTGTSRPSQEPLRGISTRCSSQEQKTIIIDHESRNKAMSQPRNERPQRVRHTSSLHESTRTSADTTRRWPARRHDKTTSQETRLMSQQETRNDRLRQDRCETRKRTRPYESRNKKRPPPSRQMRDEKTSTAPRYKTL